MAQATKQALAQSLKELLRQKPLNKITINDITDACGMNRMTFYYHFKDIYDLVEWICCEEARQALADEACCDTWQHGLLRIFHAAQANKPIVMNVYRCVHQEQMERYLKPQVDQLVLKIMRQAMGEMTIRKEDQEFIARVYSYVFVGVMLDWIKENMQAEPEQIVDRLTILMKGTIGDALARFRI